MIRAFSLSLMIALSALPLSALAFSATFSTESKIYRSPLNPTKDNTCLDIFLDVGDEDGSRIPIKGLQIELTQNYPNENHPSMPGINGPNPHTSSGAKKIDVTSKGHFIDIFGTQEVGLTDGCWEQVWRKHAFSGIIVCGFNVPDEVKRNDAKISSGSLYITFPIWKKEELMERYIQKAEVIKKSAVLLQEKENEIEKMESTNNILMKALHFRNACALTEKLTNTGYGTEWFTKVPEHKDIIEIENGYMMCTAGTVWTKKGAFLKEKVIVGHATASNKLSGLRP